MHLTEYRRGDDDQEILVDQFYDKEGSGMQGPIESGLSFPKETDYGRDEPKTTQITISSSIVECVNLTVTNWSAKRFSSQKRTQGPSLIYILSLNMLGRNGDRGREAENVLVVLLCLFGLYVWISYNNPETLRLRD